MSNTSQQIDDRKMLEADCLNGMSSQHKTFYSKNIAVNVIFKFLVISRNL